jgi:hypothetical protein
MQESVGFHLTPGQSGRLSVWEEPREKAKYVIGIDVAENRVRDRNSIARGKPLMGLERPDFSCAIVLDLETAFHVATWHGNIDVTEYGIVCAALGRYYNDALLVPEVNGPGLAVVETLSKMVGYQPLYRSKLVNRVDLDPLGTEWGFRTTMHTRVLLIAQIQSLINYGQLFTKDANLVKEIRTMEYDESGTPRGRGRNKDDRVMALGLALIGRSEIMNGTLGAGPQSTTNSRLSADDQLTWQRIKAQRQRQQDARDRARGHFRFGPRTGRLSR